MSKMVSRIENERELVLERVFNAPRALVFEMFSDGEHLKNWWGPRGWELPVSKMDFRPGGTWLYCMKCVDPNQGKFFGMEAWGKAVFEEINEPERIRYTDYFTDAEGNENPELPATKSTNQFVDMGDQTKLVSRNVYVSPEALKTVMDMGMLQGVTETWDRLEEFLQKIKATK